MKTISFYFGDSSFQKYARQINKWMDGRVLDILGICVYHKVSKIYSIYPGEDLERTSFPLKSENEYKGCQGWGGEGVVVYAAVP